MLGFSISHAVQKRFPKIPRQYLYTHAWEFINIEPLEAIIRPEIKSKPKVLVVDELVSETMRIQQRIIVRNTSVPYAFPLAQTKMISHLDVPIRVVAVTSICKQCRHRSTVLLPVSRTFILRIAVFNSPNVPMSSIRIGHYGLDGTTL